MVLKLSVILVNDRDTPAHERNINHNSLAGDMAHPNHFLRVYLYVALIFGLLGIADNLMAWLTVTAPSLYIYAIVILSLLFFIFNIITIPIFLHQRVPKIALVLPIYHVVTFLLFSSVSIILIILHLVGNQLWTSVILSIGLIASIFEAVFSIYLLQKFGFFSRPAVPSSGHMHD